VSNAVFQGAGVPDKERLLVSLRNETFGPAGKNVPVQVKVQQLNQLAELSQSLGREQEALGYYEQSLKLLRESGAGEQNQVIVLTQLSNLYLELHNQASGLRASLDGLRLSRQTGQVAAEFNFLVTLTGLYFKAEDLKQARFYAWQAFQLAQHRADANRQRRAERLLAQVDAREELQFNSQTFGSLKTLTGSFKQLTGSFKTLSPAPANTGPTPAAQAETFYERGKQLQAAKDYYQAIEAYRQALELNPQLVKAYVNRAVAFSAIHEYEAALKDYNRALGLEQHDPDIWFNRGNTYYFRHEYEAALADYNKALQLNPNDPDIWFNRGGLYRRIGQMDKAAADFHRVIELSQGRDEAGARQARNILAKMQQTIYNK
jgi:tetratricopeptide (TPR) repeat protein